MQPSKIYINNPQIVTVTCATITGYINFQCIKATYKHSVRDCNPNFKSPYVMNEFLRGTIFKIL